ncbi:MAG: uroporphyrinogen-III C-methyltransferase [Candidatus Sulfotelmatobacter sp.]
MKGKVYLVGAGPGDPDLLTLRALRAIRQADVVLHDALVSPQILELITTRVMVVNVGKRCGSKAITQEQINAMLVSFSSAGNRVVRLKAGDPLIFGRAGEEIEHLRRAGIETEVVPGITAALGAAAIAQVPLTDRRMAARVVFVSAHRVPGFSEPDWSGLSAPDTTIVVYMPGTNYRQLATRLSCAGLRGDTPCLVVARASTAEQQLHLTTIEQLHNLSLLPSPSLVIVGKVAALAVSEVPANCELRDQLVTIQGDGETAIQSSNVTRQVLAPLGAESEPVH